MYYFGKDFLSSEQADQVISFGDELGLNKASTLNRAGKFVVRPEVRDVNMGTLYFKDELSWLGKKLQKEANYIKDLFDTQYDLTLDVLGGPENENVQYLSYTQGGHYNWHIDGGETLPDRSLSMIVQLVDGGEYEGGDIVMKINGKDIIAPKRKGSCIAFPSAKVSHKVTAVTKGYRKSIVTWFLSSGNDYEI
jgi:hypothetical protein